jgi:hypothetical protein
MAMLKGFLLGTANAIVIALVLVALEGDRYIDPMITVIGAIAGPMVGALLGLVARGLATAPHRWRLAALATPAFALVGLLAIHARLNVLVGIACIPTLVAALALERWTRRAPPLPPIPVAVARVGATSMHGG